MPPPDDFTEELKKEFDLRLEKLIESNPEHQYSRYMESWYPHCWCIKKLEEAECPEEGLIAAAMDVALSTFSNKDPWEVAQSIVKTYMDMKTELMKKFGLTNQQFKDKYYGRFK